VTSSKALGASGAEGPRGFVTAKRRRPSNDIATKSPTSFTVDHRPLKAPPRHSTPKPVPQPDPFEIGRLGSTWSIISLDATKKRALARCLGCQQIREISIVDGVPSCGCGSRDAPTSSARQAALEAAR
jgi:hypothetical protein